MGLQLRIGRPEDGKACGRVCYDAFTAIAERHGFPPDWPSVEFAQAVVTSMLGRDDVHSVVAELDGRIVGSNFLHDTGAVAGIGPITVAPEVQDGAVGRRMMEYALEAAQQRQYAGVRLVQAAYHCRSMSLYAKLGFAVREPLACMQGGALGLSLPGAPVRAATMADLEACCALSVRIHGHERRSELREAIKQGTATVVERGGQVTGYATVVAFWGHAVAASTHDIQALIGATPAFLGAGFLVPTRNAALFRWCLAHGLRVTQPLTLMSVGLYNEPGGAFLPSILF
jgi:GNAT superfamily N-acetyltransferase